MNYEERKDEDAGRDNREEPTFFPGHQARPARQEGASEASGEEPVFLQGLGSRCRRYLHRSGASILYCLSALSIIYGIARIIRPILGTSDRLVETLPCVGALNLYELALLGVLVLIAFWKKVMDDAISLVILIALFLIGSGITIDTIANDNPQVVALVGLVCFVLAVAKLLIMRRYVSVPLTGLLLAGLSLVLAWNFFIPPMMATTVGKAGGTALLRTVWQLGWLMQLTGGLVIFFYAVKIPSGRSRKERQGKSLLQSPGMGWVFSLILLAAASIHQYAITYVYDLRYSFGDFLPIIILLCLLGLEILRNYGARLRYGAMLLASVPLGAVLCAVPSGSFCEGWSFSLGILWYPPVLLAISAIALFGLSLRTRSYHLMYVVGGYLLALVLMAGVSPAHPRDLNWTAAGGMLTLSLLALGIYLRNARLVLAAAVILSLGVWHSLPVQKFADAHDQSILGPVGLFAGLAILTAYCILKRDFPRWIAAIGALLFAGSAIYCFGSFPDTNYPLAASLGAVAISGVIWFRTRDPLVAAILCVPLVPAMHLHRERITGWHFVALSFVLLAAGTFFSIRKGSAQP